jgi:hypothetical protein
MVHQRRDAVTVHVPGLEFAPGTIKIAGWLPITLPAIETAQQAELRASAHGSIRGSERDFCSFFNSKFAQNYSCHACSSKHRASIKPLQTLNETHFLFPDCNLFS